MPLAPDITTDRVTTTAHDSLVQLAAQKRLPIFQHLDAETLDWIEAHRPKFDGTDPLEEVPYPFPTQRSPLDDAWFLEPRIRDGIHGTRHALRVAILANVLSFGWLPDRMRELTVLAALLHDVRRQHDKHDEAHGERCAKWIRHERKNITCLKALTDAEIELLAFTICVHDIPAETIDIDCPLERRLPSDILRTADALDRYRLPKQSWWMDQAYLNFQPDDSFAAFAFDLVLASERRFLRGEDSTSAVIHGLEDAQRSYETWK